MELCQDGSPYVFASCHAVLLCCCFDVCFLSVTMRCHCHGPQAQQPQTRPPTHPTFLGAPPWCVCNAVLLSSALHGHLCVLCVVFGAWHTVCACVVGSARIVVVEAGGYAPPATADTNLVLRVHLALGSAIGMCLGDQDDAQCVHGPLPPELDGQLRLLRLRAGRRARAWRRFGVPLVYDPSFEHELVNQASLGVVFLQFVRGAGLWVYGCGMERTGGGRQGNELMCVVVVERTQDTWRPGVTHSELQHVLEPHELQTISAQRALPM